MNRSPRLNKLWIPLLSLPLALFAMSCNIFDWIDNPSGDDQLLSAARACFDQGDFDCALKYYGELSSSANDIKNSEQAFAILDQEGASMSVFMRAIGEGTSGGKIITRMANLMSSLELGSAKRVALHAAYAKVSAIQQAELRGLVRFASSLALVAAMFAEKNGTDDSLTPADLATNATACSAGGQAGCVVNCNALIPTGAGAVDLDTGSSVVSAANVTLDMIHAGVQELFLAMSSNELGASGKFGSGTSALASDLVQNFDPQTSSACYTFGLINNGIGTE